MRSAAAKMKNTVKILRSKGTQTLVESLKDSWQEIEDMIRTNDLVIAEEDCPVECILGLQEFLEAGQKGLVNSVDSKTLILDTLGILLAFVALFGCLPVIQGIYSIFAGLGLFVVKSIYYFVYYVIYIFNFLIWILNTILRFAISFKLVKFGVLVGSAVGAVYAYRHDCWKIIRQKLQSITM